MMSFPPRAKNGFRAGPDHGPERPDGPAARPAAGGEGEAGQPAPLPRLAAVAGRLRAARTRALQRGPVRRHRPGPRGGLADDYLGLYAHDNVWRADDPGLRDAAFGYIEASRRLATRMLRLYAGAQGLPGDTFGLGDLPHLRLTVNDYPTWTYPEVTADKDKLLLLEHTDGSAVTVLGQEGDYEGLQIQAADGDWLGVPVIPGALQVFSGSLLARWTGGRLAGPAPGGRGRHGDPPLDRGLRLPGPADDGRAARSVRGRLRCRTSRGVWGRSGAEAAARAAARPTHRRPGGGFAAGRPAGGAVTGLWASLRSRRG